MYFLKKIIGIFWHTSECGSHNKYSFAPNSVIPNYSSMFQIDNTLIEKCKFMKLIRRKSFKKLVSLLYSQKERF